MLKNNPAVRDAAVFGVPDAVLGERVAGLVQLTVNASATAREDILASVKAVPTRKVFGTALNASAIAGSRDGKTMEWAGQFYDSP